MAKAVSMGQNACVQILWKIEDGNSKGHFDSEDFLLFGSLWRLTFSHDYYHKIFLKKIIQATSDEPFWTTSYIETEGRSLQFCGSSKAEKNDYFVNVWNRVGLNEDDAKLWTGMVTFVLLCTPINVSSEGTKLDKQTETPAFIDTVPCLSSLSYDFHKFLEDCSHPDIELKCKDVTISAHRTILSARSPVFAAMLNTEMAENLKGCIEVSDISPVILQQLVKYIYTAKLSDLSEETAPYLYAAADKYAVEPLKKLSALYMVDNLTKENACSHLVLFDAHGDGDFKETVVSFIVDEEELIKGASWQIFWKNYPMLACEILNRAFMKKCSAQDQPSDAI